MIMSILYDFFCGRVSTVFECGHPEGFINAVRHDIPIRDIRRVGEFSFSLNYYYSFRKRFHERADKNAVRILNEKFFGLPYILQKYKKRIGLILGAGIGIAAVYASSLFVWEIRIEGNKYITDDDICAHLYAIGFREGILKSSVDLDRLHNEYLISDSRVSWIAVNYEGTVAHVEVKETAVTPTAPELYRNANIVAKRDGQIIRVDAVDGQSAVTAGEVVSKGQLLISAFVETRHSGAMLRSARGNVWARTERNFEITVPLVYYDKIYTGNTKNQYCVSLLGKNIDLSRVSKVKYKTCNRTVTSEYISLFNCIKLPVKLTTQKYREYRLEQQKRDEIKALELAQSSLEQEIKKELGNAPIISKNTEHRIENGALKLKCSLECIENIAEYLDFEIN